MEHTINIKYTYITITITLFAITLCILTKLDIFWGLLVGLIVVSIISLINRYSPKSVYMMMWSGIKGVFTVLVMLCLIGMLISLWMASGTIPAMIYYGFKYLAGSNIILAAFIVCSIISMVLGTALGTVSTVGTVFLSLGIGFGVPLPPLVGAIVSGSYLGDRTSPMSSSANLTAVMTETNIIDNIRNMAVTTIPVIAISSIIYWFIGNRFISSAYDFENIKYLQETLLMNFSISYLSLLPPLIILISSVAFRLSIIKSITLGLISSTLIYLFANGGLISSLFNIAIYGYTPVNPEIAEFVSGGGLISMINVVLVIILSTALNGILDGTGMIEPLINKFSKGIVSFKDLIFKTSILSMIITLITCNQTLSSIIPGQYLRGIYDKQGVSKNILARTISDTGIIIVPLIPWNVNAILVSAIMGISALKYVPFAFLCYLLPIITFIYPYIKNNKAIKE